MSNEEFTKLSCKKCKSSFVEFSIIEQNDTKNSFKLIKCPKCGGDSDVVTICGKVSIGIKKPYNILDYYDNNDIFIIRIG